MFRRSVDARKYVPRYFSPVKSFPALQLWILLEALMRDEHMLAAIFWRRRQRKARCPLCILGTSKFNSIICPGQLSFAVRSYQSHFVVNSYLLLHTIKTRHREMLTPLNMTLKAPRSRCTPYNILRPPYLLQLLGLWCWENEFFIMQQPAYLGIPYH